MKNKGIILALSISLASVGLATVILSGTRTQEVSGYSASSLPTTIDLNDTSAANIRNYYSSLNNLATNQRQGTNLLKNLKTILKNGQKYYSYENGTSIWQMYEITDRDWDKSPASSTTYGSYNASTNKITNYTYGTSASSSKNNPYIHALYINRDVNNQTTAWDNHNQDEWGINREHVWPKAEGFDSSGAGGARGDPMHLMAGNGYSNNIHSNYYYGYVKTSSEYTNCGSKYSNQNGNLRGTSKTLNSGTVFEPQDCDKGDIARAIFYMVARYNYLSGSDSDGIDTNNPNLTLTQSISDWSSSGYTSSTTTQGKLGVLTDLLAWHHADPVDEYEIHRNNLLYTNFTNNRNPFIDFPEWVDFIWGTATYNGTTYKSYSSTPTGYATPSSDTINGYNSGGTPVEKTLSSISIEDPVTSFSQGDSFLFGGTVTAHYSDSSTAIVTTHASFSGYDMSTTGNQTVTVSYTEGGVTKTTTYSITVSEASSGGETYYQKITSMSDIQNGGKYAIVGYKESATQYYGMPAYSSGNNIQGVAITLSNNGTELETANMSTTAVYTLTSTGTANQYYIGTGGNYLYAAGTGTNNHLKAKSTTDSTAGAFTISYSDSFSVVAASSNRNTMRFNASNNPPIFSCYADNTNQTEIMFFKEVTQVQPQEPTSITATVNKTFKVGETITKSDITIEDDLGTTITDFEFNDYMFTYDDAASGGELTEKEFEISAGGFETDLVAEVQREAHTPKLTKKTDTLTRDLIGLTAANTYSNWSDKTVPNGSGAVYAGNSCGTYDKTTTPTAHVESIQIRSTNSNSGIVTTSSTRYVESVSISWHEYTYDGRTLDIYGSNTAYTSPAQLYNESTYGTFLGTIVKGTSDSLSVSGNYKYIGIRSDNYAIYLLGVSITYKGEIDTPKNVANYIMLEETPNQCETKFDVAVDYFENLSVSDRNTFMTSTDYVISTARTRFLAWAANQGKQIQHINGDYVVKAPSNLIFDMIGTGSHDSSLSVVIIAGILGGAIALGSYLIIKRRKHE